MRGRRIRRRIASWSETRSELLAAVVADDGALTRMENMQGNAGGNAHVEEEGEEDRSDPSGEIRLVDRPYLILGKSRSGKRAERLGLGASVRAKRRRILHHGGICKFRCETKERAWQGRQDGDEREEWDEVHQACGSGFVRPPPSVRLPFFLLFFLPFFLSFFLPSFLRSCTHGSCSYRLWQFPRRTLWEEEREGRASMRVSRAYVLGGTLRVMYRRLSGIRSFRWCTKIWWIKSTICAQSEASMCPLNDPWNFGEKKSKCI